MSSIAHKTRRQGAEQGTCVSLCSRGTSQSEASHNNRDATEQKIPSSKGACTLLQPMHSLCSYEIPARLHLTFSFHHFSCPTAAEEGGQLCKLLEEDRQVLPCRQQAWESWQQLAASIPTSCLHGASDPGQGSAPMVRGGQLCAGAEDNAGLPMLKAGSTIERYLPVPSAAAGEHPPPDANSCLRNVHTSHRVTRYAATCQQCLQAFEGAEGLKGWEWGTQMYPTLLVLAPSRLGVSHRHFMLACGLCPLPPQFSQNGGGMRMGCITLPMIAKSWANSQIVASPKK